MDSSADSVRGADPAGQPTESLLNTCPKNGGNFISPPTKNPLDEIVTSATFALVEMEREARSDVDTNSRSAKLYELWQVGTMRFVLHFTIALLFFFLLRFLSNWIAENILHELIVLATKKRNPQYQGLYPAYPFLLATAVFVFIIPQFRYFTARMFLHMAPYVEGLFGTEGRFTRLANEQPLVPALSPQEKDRMNYELTVARHQVELARLAAEREKYLTDLRESQARARKADEEGRPQPKPPPKLKRKREEILADYISESKRFVDAINAIYGIDDEDKEAIIREEKRQLRERIMDFQEG